MSAAPSSISGAPALKRHLSVRCRTKLIRRDFKRLLIKEVPVPSDRLHASILSEHVCAADGWAQSGSQALGKACARWQSFLTSDGTMLRSGKGPDLSTWMPPCFSKFDDSRGLELVVRGRDFSELGMRLALVEVARVTSRGVSINGWQARLLTWGSSPR